MNPLDLVLERTATLAAALRELLAAAGHTDPRVRDLTERLGLNKSTASRVARGVRSVSPEIAFSELPTAEGIDAVVGACAACGAPEGLAAEAARAASSLEEVVRAFPGGRSAVLAAVSGVGSEGRGTADRARRERRARRDAALAASYLQGISVDASLHGLVLGPGTRPDRLHQAMVSGVMGVRRLRPGPPITVAGVYGSTLNERTPSRTTLSGEAVGEDPRRTLLPEFCAGDTSRLRVDREGARYVLWWGAEDPPLDEPATVVYGVKNVDFVEREKSERFHHTSTNYTVRRPTMLLVIEVLVWREAGLRGPTVRFSMDPNRAPDPINGPPRDGREMLEQAASFVPMMRGFERAGTRRADAFVPIMRRAMDLLGWEPSEFMRYRLQIEYPLAFVGTQVWFELADAAGA